MQMDVERTAKTEAEEIQADFAVMAGSLRNLLVDLVYALGGEHVDDRQGDMFRPQTGPALRADDAEDDDLADPLLGQARQLVAEHGRASVSSSSAICALATTAPPPSWNPWSRPAWSRLCERMAAAK